MFIENCNLYLPDDLISRVELHRKRMVKSLLENGAHDVAERVSNSSFNLVLSDYIMKNYGAMFKRDMLDDFE